MKVRSDALLSRKLRCNPLRNKSAGLDGYLQTGGRYALQRKVLVTDHLSFRPSNFSMASTQSGHISTASLVPRS